MNHFPFRVYPSDLLGWSLPELVALATLLLAVLAVLLVFRGRR
jgi:disulfide bond formation protein DsbB